MGVLTGITLRAVDRLVVALDDLKIPLTLKKRTPVAYVPGQDQTYTTATVTVQGVILKYRYEEIDGTMIKAEDALIIVFPPTTGEMPLQNDVVANGSKEYRVVNNNPMYAGNSVAFNMVQGRPV